jgi:hypothetical protein
MHRKWKYCLILTLSLLMSCIQGDLKKGNF